MLLISPEKFSVNDSMCEIKVHGTRDFPFQGYMNEPKDIRGEGWHWHREAEFLLVLEGKIRGGTTENSIFWKKAKGSL